MLAYLLSLLEDEADQAILTSIYGRFERKTYAVALSILGDAQDAEDAVMAAWEKVVLHFETAKEYLSSDHRALEGWLITIAKNAAKDERRKKHRAPEPVEIWGSSCVVNPENEYEVMVELIRSMPDQMRRVLEMRGAGYSYKEIGRSLGCSEDTARKRYDRVVEELKKRMEI